MILLAIDTTGACSSVALNIDGKIVQKINASEFSHLQKLIPTVDALLKEEKISAQKLDAIAVSRGPGSFTGIRIGMASAKGLAQIWNKPIVEVPTLASFAFRNYDFDISKDAALCGVFDAKRHQIYGGAYHPFSDEPIIPDGAYDLDEYLDLLRSAKDKFGKAFFFGDGIKAYEEGLKACGFDFAFAPEEKRMQTAEGVALLGAKLFEEGKTADCFTAQPEYLRAAEAERKLAEKIKADSVKFGTAESSKN